MIYRFLDLLLAGAGLIITSPLLLIIWTRVSIDTGAPIFRQQRIGKGRRPFILLKFRTMRLDTPSLATHLVDPSSVTAMGAILRQIKLDELPQLWNVLKGEMSLVGPRPCLPSQTQLIACREALGVFNARPGITGLAQIQGVDMSTPEQLAQLDAEMLRTMSVRQYIKYIVVTLSGAGRGDRIQH